MLVLKRKVNEGLEIGNLIIRVLNIDRINKEVLIEILELENENDRDSFESIIKRSSGAKTKAS